MEAMRFARPIVVNQAIFRNRIQSFELLHGNIELLHKFALEEVGLSADDFESDDMGRCSYWLSNHERELATSKGATPATPFDKEVSTCRGNLMIQLSRNPALGKEYAENFGQEELETTQEKEERRLRTFAYLRAAYPTDTQAVRNHRAASWIEYRKEFG